MKVGPRGEARTEPEPALGGAAAPFLRRADRAPPPCVPPQYRDGRDKSWTSFSGSYQQHHGWWRSPSWGARGNCKCGAEPPLLRCAVP